ncbi:MAG: transglutaminase domain-containing protein [Planctomycetota bacterium]|nr:transglutaminase domain-containing protein [Planctomycetota bacterium]
MLPLPALIAWLLGAVLLAADEANAASDRWFVARLGTEAAMHPMLSLHVVSSPIPEGGGRSTVLEWTIALRRPLQGREWRIEMRRRQEEREDATGRLQSLRIEQDVDQVRTVATAAVQGERVLAEVARHGVRSARELVVPSGLTLLGTLAFQQRLAALAERSPPTAEAPWRTALLELVGGELVVAEQRASFRGIAEDGGLGYDIASDLVPTPTALVVSRRGELMRMDLRLGWLRFELRPASGPVALFGAAIDAASMVAGAGPAPRGAERERYRLPEGLRVPDDAFQTQVGDIVEVRSEARAEPLAESAPWLSRTAFLEIDDPELVAWVQDALTGRSSAEERLEALVAAVRGRITTRDLSVADGSALDAFRTRTGDCTEHANLLCAALRIAGIPARREIGLIRPPGAAHWVGHAWVSAWVDGRWRHADAAHPGVPRSCYIALVAADPQSASSTGGALLAALDRLMGREIATVTDQVLP